MTQRSCDLCHNPAVIHDTVTRNSTVTVRHFCRVHGLPVWRGALPAQNIPPKPTAGNSLVKSPIAEAGKLLQRRGDTQPPQ